jgi:hypothetical protein
VFDVGGLLEIESCDACWHLYANRLDPRRLTDEEANALPEAQEALQQESDVTGLPVFDGFHNASQASH